MTRADELQAIEDAIADGQRYRSISRDEMITYNNRQRAAPYDERGAIRAMFAGWMRKPPQT